MKYIRTKDGRINYLIREPNEEITDYEIITSKGTLTYRREDEVIKIADNIEELCDEFVWIKDKKHFIADYDDISFDKPCLFLKGIGSDKPFMVDDCLKKGKIFGAIWTNDGLIYVAEYKLGGEWKLL